MHWWSETAVLSLFRRQDVCIWIAKRQRQVVVPQHRQQSIPHSVLAHPLLPRRTQEGPTCTSLGTGAAPLWPASARTYTTRFIHMWVRKKWFRWLFVPLTSTPPHPWWRKTVFLTRFHQQWLIWEVLGLRSPSPMRRNYIDFIIITVFYILLLGENINKSALSGDFVCF